MYPCAHRAGAGGYRYFLSTTGWLGSGAEPSTVVPKAPEHYDANAYEAMRVFREPFVEVHEFNFFILVFVVLIHAVAVIITDIHEAVD
jgi:Ni/Fe-hydrogenase 1 B-type cytochrome subunit